ncbi:MAG: immunoglobulin domain-containing protein [Planctomycetota bacterium]
MNHFLKHSSAGLTLALTSWLASAPSAQQAPTTAPNKVKPAEQLRIEPVQAAWNELLPLDAVNRTIPSQLIVSSVGPIEIPPIEISPNGKVLSAPAAEVHAASGPCGTPFLAEPTSITSFDGQLDDGTTSGFSYAPNVSGAVGPNHLFTLSDTQAVVQGRDGSAISSMTSITFWTPVYAGPLLYSRANYDNVSDRFIASARSGTGGTMALLLAVSATDDPTGAWNYYGITADPAGLQFPDWTPHGYNPNWIAITANMFNVTGGAFAGSKAWMCDKSAALAGASMTVSVFPAGFLTTVHGSGGNGPMPTRDMDGSTGTMYFLNNAFTSSGFFGLIQITVITGGPTTPVAAGIAGSPFGGTTSLAFVSQNYTTTQRIMEQLGDARDMSPFSIRGASALVRNGKIWETHSVGLPGPTNNTAPTQTGINWYQIDPTLPFPASSGAPGSMIVQNGQITAGALTATIMPSLAVNCAEDMVLGFTNGDVTKFSEASYVFRLGSDPVNTNGPIRLLAAGLSNYWKTLAGTTAPWGLASSSAVDPRDDSSLWTLQKYAGLRVTPGTAPDTDSRWATRWGRLGFTGTITDQPDSLAICQGDTAVFQVVASSSNGPLTYQWRKDTIELSGETADTLTLATTVLGDLGSYDCVIYDANGGEVSAAATLTFNEPTITTQPANVAVAVGGPASFSVVASGTGTLTYQWEFNGNPILGATSDTYSIAATVKPDYGAYTCVVSDDCGFVESNVGNLQAPTQSGKAQLGALSFQILTQPVSTIGCLNDSVTFTVVAAGNNVTYQWRKNFVDMGGETGSSLTLSSLTAGDSAFYDVRLTSGSQNKTSFPAFLTLTDDPAITLQPTPGSQTVSVGDSVSYTVAATGLNLTYQWRFRSTVPNSPFVNLVGENGPTLFLDPVNSGDAGSYRCVVQNLCGSVTSSTVQLLVF